MVNQLRLKTADILLLTRGPKRNPCTESQPPEVSIRVGESNERCINYIRYPSYPGQHDLRCSLATVQNAGLKVVLSAHFCFFLFLPKGLSLRRGLGHNLKLAFWRGGQNGLRRLKLALKSAFKQTFRPDWAWRTGVVFLYIPWFYFFLSPSWSP